MYIALVLITFLAIIGNYGIAQYKHTTFYQWVALSLLVGPLSWPLQWNANHN